ncbi:MAG: hypothetical protein HY074_08080 [Deltaproteobacteria bacterium]|nr:hypothetical protein [Deltaproteobacteria bacterium]
MANARGDQSRPAVALAAIFAGIVLGLAACEVLVRIFVNPAQHYDRLLMIAPNYALGVDCYPAENGTGMLIDLRREEDRELFKQVVPMLKLASSGSAEFEPALAPLKNPIPAERAIDLLRDHHPSDLMQVRVRSYAQIGANIDQIWGEFKKAMAENQRFHFSRVIYVFVLNDPYLVPELAAHERRIDDFMNVRWSRWQRQPNAAWAALAEASKVSVLADLLLNRVLNTVVRRSTIEWYLDIFDRDLNPAIIPTFNRIAAMRDEAQRAGIDFQLVVYPLIYELKNYPFDRIHQTIASLAAARNISMTDLLPAFVREEQGRSLVVHTIDSHPNSLAQSIAATATARFLRSLPKGGKIK